MTTLDFGTIWSSVGRVAGLAGLLVATACDGEGDDTADDAADGATEDSGASDGADGSDGADESGGAPTFSGDIEPILAANCMACHVDGGIGAAFWTVESGAAGLVGVASTQAMDLQLVEAANSSASYLVNKLRNTQTDVGGSGTQMPQGGTPLAEADIALIEAWIDGGALE